MTEKEKHALICRVVSGYTILGNYIIDTPTDSLTNESLVVYSETMYKNRFEGLMMEEDIEGLLFKLKMWTPKDTINLKELDNSLDDAKLELYTNYGMPETNVKRIRQRIEIIKKKKAEQLNTRHGFDRYTLEGLADYAAENYIFSKIVLNREYEPVKVAPMVLSRLINKYKQSWPSNADMRLIARTEPWRSFWSTNPTGFRILGDEQKVLILFSKMYDNVYEHPERPVDNIINDDDMLDGWFISIKRKNAEIKKENAKTAIVQKHPNAKEIFMAASSPEHAKEIEEMNDARARIIKGKIEAGMKDGGIVRDKDIMELRIGS